MLHVTCQVPCGVRQLAQHGAPVYNQTLMNTLGLYYILYDRPAHNSREVEQNWEPINHLIRCRQTLSEWENAPGWSFEAPQKD